MTEHYAQQTGEEPTVVDVSAEEAIRIRRTQMLVAIRRRAAADRETELLVAGY